MNILTNKCAEKQIKCNDYPILMKGSIFETDNKYLFVNFWNLVRIKIRFKSGICCNIFAAVFCSKDRF